jgi:hypothetical protein
MLVAEMYAIDSSKIFRVPSDIAEWMDALLDERTDI